MVVKTAEKRKYKGGDFGVNVGAKVPPETFNEIETLAKALGKTRAEVLRVLLDRGLAAYHSDEKLSTQSILFDRSEGDFSGDCDGR